MVLLKSPRETELIDFFITECLVKKYFVKVTRQNKLKHLSVAFFSGSHALSPCREKISVSTVIHNLALEILYP